MGLALTFELDRNTESDMSHYNVYVCHSCTVTNGLLPTVASTKLMSLPQTALGIKPSFVMPPNEAGMVGVTAIDTSNNESGMSNALPFSTVIDIIAPGKPTNLIIK